MATVWYCKRWSTGDMMPSNVVGFTSLLKLLSFTLIQFSNIIYLVQGKTVNSFNSFEGLTFAAGTYATRINRRKLHFLSPFSEYLFRWKHFLFSWLVLDCLVTFSSQLCLISLTQECECLHSCIPSLIHNSLEVSTSAHNESVNPAWGFHDDPRWFDNVITTEESYMSIHNPLTEQQCSQWVRRGGLPPESMFVCKSAHDSFIKQAWLTEQQWVRRGDPLPESMLVCKSARDSIIKRAWSRVIRRQDGFVRKARNPLEATRGRTECKEGCLGVLVWTATRTEPNWTGQPLAASFVASAWASGCW